LSGHPALRIKGGWMYVAASSCSSELLCVETTSYAVLDESDVCSLMMQAGLPDGMGTLRQYDRTVS
jgi:hypothetical protein